MNIQNVVEQTGLTKRMIRHYEDFGLILPLRDENKYRNYTAMDVERLNGIRALRQIGFSLEDIKHILQEEHLEAVFKKHLQELLFGQREAFVEQQKNIEIIKKLLRAQNVNIHTLLDRMATLKSPTESAKDPLDELLGRSTFIHGRIREFQKLAEEVQFGPLADFKITSIEFTKFGSFYEKDLYQEASICSCDEMYTHFIMLTKIGAPFDENFHRTVWSQFARSWKNYAEVFGITFEVMTRNISGLEKLHNSKDVVITLQATNASGDEFAMLFPYQQFHIFLKRGHGPYQSELTAHEKLRIYG